MSSSSPTRIVPTASSPSHRPLSLRPRHPDARSLVQGTGASGLELGLRLRYEIRREFASYIGVNWDKLFGGTADYAREEGESTNDLQFVVGVRTWF